MFKLIGLLMDSANREKEAQKKDKAKERIESENMVIESYFAEKRGFFFPSAFRDYDLERIIEFVIKEHKEHLKWVEANSIKIRMQNETKEDK